MVRDGQEITLRNRPSRMRVLATLELPVKDEEGTYLAVMHPDYARSELVDDNGTRLPAEPGEWTPPYVSYDVPDGQHLPNFAKNTGRLFDRFHKTVATDAVEHDLGSYANRIGLGCSTFESLNDDFYEFKRSFSSPNEYRGYQFRRFLGEVEKDDLPNIADHEMRKGFAFLPIDDRFRELRTRRCDRHQRLERLFMGMPIANNLRTILEDEGRRETLCAKAVEVPPTFLSSSYDGFIFAGDLAGYGRFCQFLESHSGSLSTTGEAGAQEFRDLAIRLFTKLFHRADIRHVHTAGDGFICALPRSELPSGEERLSHALRAYIQMTAQLDDVNGRAASLAKQQKVDAPPVLGSRLAVHHGSYRFGKMSLLASLLPTLDGSSVIEAARIEAGLRNWIYGRGEERKHWVAVSQEAATELVKFRSSEPTEFGPFSSVTSANLSEKEFSSSVEVWEVSGDA